MKGVILEVLVASLLAYANSEELESKMHHSDPDVFITTYFGSTWPSGVKSFMVPITNTSNSLIGSGIFIRWNIFLMSATCINEYLKYEVILPENLNSDFCTQRFMIGSNPKKYGFIATAIANPGIRAPELDNIANLINREHIPDNVPLYTLGWTLDRKVFIRQCYAAQTFTEIRVMICETTDEKYIIRPGDPLFYNGRLVGLFSEMQFQSNDIDFFYIYRNMNDIIETLT